RLEDAIRHHLDVFTSARNYNPTAAGVAPDLRGPLGPIEPVLARIDPLVAQPTPLTDDELNWLVQSVLNGRLDNGATPQNLQSLVPNTVPSGRPVLTFEF